jgi:hypothetical protein
MYKFSQKLSQTNPCQGQFYIWNWDLSFSKVVLWVEKSNIKSSKAYPFWSFSDDKFARHIRKILKVGFCGILDHQRFTRTSLKLSKIIIQVNLELPRQKCLYIPNHIFDSQYQTSTSFWRFDCSTGCFDKILKNDWEITVKSGPIYIWNSSFFMILVKCIHFIYENR